MNNLLQDLKDYMSKNLYGMTVSEARSKGICIECKKPALERCYSDAGRSLYNMSGLCEVCFDEMFKEEDWDSGE